MESLWHVLLAEHLKMRQPAPLDWEPVETLEGLPPQERLLAAPAALLVADGFSCREQIAQSGGRRALHLAEVLEMALGEPRRS